MTDPMVYPLFMMPVLLTLGSVWRKHPPLRQTVLAQELYPLPSSLAYFLLATVAMSSRQGPGRRSTLRRRRSSRPRCSQPVTMEKRGRSVPRPRRNDSQSNRAQRKHLPQIGGAGAPVDLAGHDHVGAGDAADRNEAALGRS
jgi:hypothetical protein